MAEEGPPIRDSFSRKRMAAYLLGGFSKGVDSLKVNYWDAAFNPMFVDGGGNIFGLKLRASRMSLNNDIHKFRAGKFGAHLSWHPQAVEIYTSGSPPELLPLTGFYLGGGVGLVYGYATRNSDNRSINLKTPSFSLGAGYDWEHWYLSMQKNIYILLPKNSIDFKVPSDIVLSCGFRIFL